MSYTLRHAGEEIDVLLDKAGTALQEHQDISHLATKDELSDGLNKKQDIIEDLESIRDNASKGATALQSVPSEYVTEQELEGKGYLTSVPSEYITEEELEGKGYLTEHQSLAHLATKSELEGKVDKVVGKQLSTEDFTTLLKEKLESLKNYDDAELVSRIEAIQETIDTLFGKDASSAIESFNEIIAFLEGIEDSESLDSIIASIEQQIADVAKAIPSKVSELENDKGYLTEHQDVSHLATREELTSGLATKQDTITDLDAIRSGAAKGATALQSVPSEYVTETELNDKGYLTEHQDISGKADKNNYTRFSTEETRIGTWINGKPIYRKTIVYTCEDLTKTKYWAYYPSDTTGTEISDLNIDSYVGMNGVTFCANQAVATGAWQPIPRVCPDANESYNIGFGDLKPTRVGVLFGNKYLSATVYLTIEYTKTTD